MADRWFKGEGDGPELAREATEGIVAVFAEHGLRALADAAARRSRRRRGVRSNQSTTFVDVTAEHIEQRGSDSRARAAAGPARDGHRASVDERTLFHALARARTGRPIERWSRARCTPSGRPGSTARAREPVDASPAAAWSQAPSRIEPPATASTVTGTARSARRRSRAPERPGQVGESRRRIPARSHGPRAVPGRQRAEGAEGQRDVASRRARCASALPLAPVRRRTEPRRSRRRPARRRAPAPCRANRGPGGGRACAGLMRAQATARERPGPATAGMWRRACAPSRARGRVPPHRCRVERVVRVAVGQVDGAPAFDAAERADQVVAVLLAAQ